MTLLDIITRLKVQGPTTLTVDEALHLHTLEQRIKRGEHIGAILMEEGVTPQALAVLQPDPDVMERAMQVLRERLN